MAAKRCHSSGARAGCFAIINRERHKHRNHRIRTMVILFAVVTRERVAQAFRVRTIFISDAASTTLTIIPGANASLP